MINLFNIIQYKVFSVSWKIHMAFRNPLNGIMSVDTIHVKYCIVLFISQQTLVPRLDLKHNPF